MDVRLVFIDQRLPHPEGVLGVHAENHGFLVGVADFLQVTRDGLRHEFRALVYDDVPVKVLLVINPVLELVAIHVGFSRLRAVTFHVLVDVDFHHLVGSEEAIGDALLERVGVKRLAEILDIRNIFGFLRGGSEADLGGGGEMLEDFPPSGILCGAATVALVDDDEVEEIG